MEFETMQQFKKAVRKFNINLGRSIFFQGLIQLDAKLFAMMKTACGKFTVPRGHIRIRNQPDITVKDAENYFRTEFDVLVNERKIYRSMATARERIEGLGFEEERGDMAPLNTGHNSRGCDKKKEAIASGGATAGSGSQHQGAAATTEGMAADDLDEDAAREQEMYWKETLEVADAKASASEPPNVNVDVVNSVTPSEEPMAVRPPPSNSSTADVPPRPMMKPTMSKRPIRRRNVKRPPPSQPSPLKPTPPQPTPITPTTPQPSLVRPTSPTNQPPPKVTGQTMHGATRGTTTRFMRFMPTPPSTSQIAGRWPVPRFCPPTGASSSGNNNGGSSGSSNSTPNK
ncbi:hypothetical protein Ahy_B08g092032 [Arachis hypogaea]|uniref:Uncharacterized protein n=1 Tax=Arachis hypogaea TaxID=3818 RepID=A0A444Y346_ARAHY|nr:hypothetical protein Ahy_B08g092032 [Arachis hypogaea]